MTTLLDTPTLAGALTRPSDTDLAQLIESNRGALEAFVRVRASAAIRARESVSDLVQSVCRELVTDKSEFEYRGEAAFRSWLFTAALRKIVARDRHQHRDKRDVSRLVAGSDADRLLDAYATCTTPSMHASSEEQVAAIESAFEELTDEQREVLTLARLAGLDHKQIAEQTGRSEQASRQILRRALIRLETILDQRGHGPAAD